MIDIKFKFPKWSEAFRAKRDEIDLFIAAQMQFNRGMLFDNEGAYNGHPRWKDLVFRRGQILSKRGVLRKSMAPNSGGRAGPDGIVRFSGDVITIGTKLAYAKLMNDGTARLPGGVLRPVSAKALKIPVPPGMASNQRHQVKNIEAELSASRIKDKKRLDSLNRRLDKARSLLSEAKGNASAKKRKDYIARLEAQMRASKDRNEIKTLSRKKNRVEGSKGDFIFRKSVKIPGRPFDQWNQEDERELSEALMNKLAEVLGGV